jgi:hypothetical protein
VRPTSFTTLSAFGLSRQMAATAVSGRTEKSQPLTQADIVRHRQIGRRLPARAVRSSRRPQLGERSSPLTAAVAARTEADRQIVANREQCAALRARRPRLAATLNVPVAMTSGRLGQSDRNAHKTSNPARRVHCDRVDRRGRIASREGVAIVST